MYQFIIGNDPEFTGLNVELNQLESIQDLYKPDRIVIDNNLRTLTIYWNE